MLDLISRQAAIDALRNQMSDWNDDYNVPVRKSIENIERLPSAQPETICVANVTLSDEQIRKAVDRVKNEVISVLPSEQKKGKWKLAEDGWYCTACELYPPFDCDPEEKGIPFCPNCGAEIER